jgi:signal transduction histidine kinase
VDRDRQWFKSHHGLDARETPRQLAFCAHAILDDHPLVVEDSIKDERFHDNPLVTGAPHVKFYAGAPLILRKNIRIGTLCVIDDHARPLSENQLQALEAIARQVVSQLELRLQLQALTRLDRTKDEFISMVNHELRTPLTSINGALSLLRNQVTGELPPQSMQLVDVAYRNGERLLNIVNDILDVSKLEAGKMEMHMGVLELEPFLQKAIELNRPYCEAYGCRLELHPAETGGAVRVMGDEQRLLQVLSNLISNAAKFSHAGDIIELAFRRQGDRVEVGVTDHGPGIPQEKQKDLFTKFKQLSRDSNAKAPGTGLGLNICKLIVEQQGGSIACDSVPGDHTTFHFTLPAHVAPS